ncbi:MAG: hypothetical protein Q9174_003482 [Haloplaca sp. 1 TL-2023]
MAGPSMGDAIFSTDKGRLAPRDLNMLPSRIILRSSPDDDMESMVTDLQAKFPVECKEIIAAPESLSDYFDAYDRELHGVSFLTSVLKAIAFRNQARRASVTNVAREWLQLNPMAFGQMLGYELNAFTDDDMESFGADFLQEVLEVLQGWKLDQDERGQYSPSLNAVLCSSTLDQDSVAVQEPSAQVSDALRHSPAPPQQQSFPSSGRNSSAPAYPNMALNQYQPPPYIPGRTPTVPYAPLVPGPYPPPPQLHHNGTYGTMEPPLHSAPPQPFQQPEFPFHRNEFVRYLPDSDPSWKIPPGPNLAVMGAPSSYHRVPNSSRTMHLPGRRPRPSFRGPIWQGPSNDARSPGQQDGSRAPFLNDQPPMNFAYPHPAGPSVSFGSEYQTPRFPPGLPQGNKQGMGPGPSKLSNNMVVRDWDTSPKASVDNSGEPSNTRQAPGSYSDPTYGHHRTPPSGIHATPPRRRGDSLADSGSMKRLPHPTATPRVSNQRPSADDWRSSLAPHRNSMSSSHTQEGKHFGRNNHFGSAPRADTRPLSDRKVWIGGLPNDSNYESVVELVSTWGPISISPICRGNFTRPAGAFFFAEFEDPSQATDMIEKLDRRFIEALGRDITVRPAYINHPYEEKDGSPKRIERRRAGHPYDRDSRGSQSEFYNQYPTDVAKSDLQGPMAATSKQSVYGKNQELSEHEMPSVSRPAPGNAPSPSKSAFEGANDIKAADNEQKSASQSGTFVGVPDRRDQIEAVDPNNVAVQSGIAAQPDVTAQSGKPAKQKTPSPQKKKKKNGKANEDGSKIEGTLTSKERKAMLSGLRTERSNAARSDTMAMPTSHAAEPVQASQSTEFSKEEVPRSNEGSTFHASGAVSPSHLRKELTAVASTHGHVSSGHVSSETLSHMQSTSHSKQGSGSTSLMVSTNPTSYTHSEGSETRQESTQISPSEAEESLKAVTMELAPTSSITPKAEAHMSPARSVAPVSTPKNSPKKIHGPSSAENQGTSSTKEPLGLHTESQTKLDENEFPPLPESASKTGAPQSISKEISVNIPGAKATRKADSDKPSAAPAGTRKAKQAAEKQKPASKGSEQTPQDTAGGKTSKDLKALVAVPNLPPIAKIRKPRAPSVPRAEASDEGAKSTVLTQENVDTAMDTGVTSLPPPTQPSIPTAERSQVDASAPIASLTEHHEDAELQAPSSIDHGVSEQSSSEQENHEAVCKINEDGSDARSSPTLEGDSFATAQGTPEGSPDREFHDAGDHNAVQQSNEEHPIVEQKKKKKSKKPKKPKRSKTSQTNAGESSSSAHPGASTKDENTTAVVAPDVAVPKAETPFLSDENTQLVVPRFPMQNHSSMGGGSGAEVDVPGNKKPVLDIGSYPQNQIDQQELDGSSSALDAASSHGSSEFLFRPISPSDVTQIPEPNPNPPVLDPPIREERMQFLRDWMRSRNKVDIGTALEVLDTLKGTKEEQDNEQSEKSSTAGSPTTGSQSVQPATLSSLSSIQQSRRESMATAYNDDFPSLSSILPSDGQPSERPSYRNVAAAEPAGPIQTGDVVEVVSKAGDGDAAGGKGDLAVVRKCPWRVPSDEPRWGKNTNGKTGNLASDEQS